MVVAPMLNGGRMENRWQPMSQLTWCGPSSRSSSLMAVKIGRSGQPVQNEGGRGCTSSVAAWMAKALGLPSIGAGTGAGLAATGSCTPASNCGA